MTDRMWLDHCRSFQRFEPSRRNQFVARMRELFALIMLIHISSVDHELSNSHDAVTESFAFEAYTSTVRYRLFSGFDQF